MDKSLLRLNLQLFATTMTTETGSLSAEMKTFYEKRLLDQAEPLLVHNQFGDKYPIPANNGKKIEFRKYSALPKALTALTEGVTPAGNSLTVTTVEGTVKQYGDWIQLSDMLQMTAIDNNVVQATKLLSSQAGRTLDTVTREVLAGGTNVIYAPKVVDGAETEVLSRSTLTPECVLTPFVVMRAAATLEAMNTPKIDGSYVLIIHPYCRETLQESPGWVDVVKYKEGNNTFSGEIGKIGDVRVVTTSEAKVINDSTCPVVDSTTYYSVFTSLLLGANAYGVTELENGGLQHIVKQLGYGEDPLNQRSSCGWKATSVAVRLCEEYMVRIESLSPVWSKKVKAN